MLPLKDTAVCTAIAQFLRQSKIAEEKLKHGEKLPRIQRHMYSTFSSAYWEIIGADVVCIVLYVLSCCAASEAEFFSTEGLFHNDVRSVINISNDN